MLGQPSPDHREKHELPSLHLPFIRYKKKQKPGTLDVGAHYYVVS